jgi:hypothetical protein
VSKITELASGHINPSDNLTIELVEAHETPAVVIVRWPAEASVFHPSRFASGANKVAHIFAAAASGWRNSAGSGGFENKKQRWVRTLTSRYCPHVDLTTILSEGLLGRFWVIDGRSKGRLDESTAVSGSVRLLGNEIRAKILIPV